MTSCFTTNLSLSLPVKVFLKLVNSWQSYGKMVDCFMPARFSRVSFACAFFLKYAELAT